MRRALSQIAILAILQSSVALGQSADTAAARRYADAITRSADSVALILQSAPNDVFAQAYAAIDSGKRAMLPVPLDSVWALASNVSVRTARLIEDFDAVVPPPSLQRVHEQMLKSLRHGKASLDSLGLTARFCEALFPHDDNWQSLRGMTKCRVPFLISSLNSKEAPVDYLTVRKRAAAGLAQLGVQLADAKGIVNPFAKSTP